MDKPEQEQPEKLEDYDGKWFPCPACMTIHEWTVPCFEVLETGFREALMLEFKIIDDMEYGIRN